MEEGRQAMCRVCWSETETEDNPKVSPCKCDGSVKWIHFKCLKVWMENKMQTKSSDCHHTISWK